METGPEDERPELVGIGVGWETRASLNPELILAIEDTSDGVVPRLDLFSTGGKEREDD